MDWWIESKDLNLLEPAFAEKLGRLIKKCESEKGLVVRISVGLRGPAAQAKAWCRSRSPEEVHKWKSLIQNSAPILASLLNPDWAGTDPTESYRLPGVSWHQWGQAANLYSLVDDRAIWSGSVAMAIAAVAARVGLHHSYLNPQWRPSRRKWHVQLDHAENPLMIRGLVDGMSEVETEMLKKFGKPTWL